MLYFFSLEIILGIVCYGNFEKFPSKMNAFLREKKGVFLNPSVWKSCLRIRIFEYGLIVTQFSIQFVSLIKQIK